jgi:hypothetical protein
VGRSATPSVTHVTVGCPTPTAAAPSSWERVARLRGLQRTHMRRVQAVSSGVTGDLTAMGVLVDEELLLASPSLPHLPHQPSFDYINGWRPLSPQPHLASSLLTRRVSPSTQPLCMDASTTSISTASTAAHRPTQTQADSDDAVRPPPLPTSAVTPAAAVSEPQPMRSGATEEENPSAGANTPPATAGTLSPLIVPVRLPTHIVPVPSRCPQDALKMPSRASQRLL